MAQQQRGIRSYRQADIAMLVEGRNPVAPKCLPTALYRPAVRRLIVLDAAYDLRDLSRIPGYHLEKMRGDWKGYYSIRINEAYRILFRWEDDGVYDVTVTNHYD